jgi:hypothetical protein
VVPIIDTEDALTEYAASLEVDATTAAPAGTAAPADTAAAASPIAPQAAAAGYAAVPCLDSDQSILGPIVYQGTPAFAVRNTSTDELQAIDGTDCHVLAEVAAP